MKSILLAVAALVSVCSLSYAGQEGSTETTVDRSASSEQRLVRRIIPQADLVYSNYQGDVINRQGYAVGALVDLGTGYHLVVETGALYRQLNASFNNSFGNTDYTANYISVPASLKWYFSGQENSSLYIKAGAQASTLINQNATYSPGYTGSSRDLNGRSWEFAGLGGVGAKLYLSRSSDLILEADYTRATDTLFTNANGNVYDSAFNFGAGVAFNL